MKIFEVVSDVLERSEKNITTRELNKLLKQVTQKHPPAGLKNRHPKLRYMTQTGERPPEFTIFGSQLDYLHWSYKRHIENALREQYDFTGVPLRIQYRDRDADKNEE